MYTIERIENDIVILENRKTLEIIEINKSEFPINIKEQDIVYYENNKYVINILKTKETKNRINNLFNSLKE